MYKTVQDAALWQLHYVQYGLVAEPTMVVSTWSLLMAYFWCVLLLYGNYTMCNLTLHQNPLRQQVRPT